MNQTKPSESRWVGTARCAVRAAQSVAAGCDGSFMRMCSVPSALRGRGHRSAMSLLLVVAAFLITFCASAQVVRNLGTIPPGGTARITFDVMINTNFPSNTGFVTNQGSFSGTGFGPILTDSSFVGGSFDPTVLAVTVAPKIVCPANIVTNAGCALPSISFAATATGGFPAPTFTYRIGPNIIASPYTFPAGSNLVMVTAANGTLPNAFCTFVVVVTLDSPQLTVVRQGNNMVISWPTNYPCYTLQYASQLALPPGLSTWTPWGGPVVANMGRFWVTNGLTVSNRFFRLFH